MARTGKTMQQQKHRLVSTTALTIKYLQSVHPAKTIFHTIISLVYIDYIAVQIYNKDNYLYN